MAKLWSLTLSVLVAIILQDKVIGLSHNTVGIQCEKQNDWDEDQYCVCPEGNRLSQFVSKHDDGKQDRQWTLECAEIPNFIETNANYPSSTSNNYWDHDFKWDGSNHEFVVGMKSYHANRKEDRRYTMFYTRSNSWELESCSDWQKVNDFEKDVSVYLGDFEVISAVYSRHNNYYEDREWWIKTCTLDHICSEIIDITYDVANKEVLESGEVTAGKNNIDNSLSSVSTKYTVKITESNQETLGTSYSFESSDTVSTSFSMSMSTGIDVKVFTAAQEFGITLSTDQTNSLKRSESTTYSQSNGQQLKYEVTCPAVHECSATILVKQEKVSVPYTITRQTPGDTKTCVENGNLVATRAFDANFVAVNERASCR